MSMWGRKQEEPAPPPKPVTTPKPAPLAPSPTEPKKEAPSLSTNVPPRMDSEPTRGSAATIGKAVKIVGQIFSKEDLYVDGDVEGTIELMEHRLTVGPNGKVQAAVRAREVVALGTIQGNVEAADRLEIRKDAKLIGDVKTARISIEDGAYLKGSIDIVKPEPARQAPRQPQPAPAAAAQVPAGNAAEAKR